VNTSAQVLDIRQSESKVGDPPSPARLALFAQRRE